MPKPHVVNSAVVAALVCGVICSFLPAGCAAPGTPAALAVYRPDELPAKDLIAFPQAEGFGAYSVGGRGGKLYVVTSLEDSSRRDGVSAGTLREAVEADGPRIVVFAVSGTITLNDLLHVQNPYLTIAGQTAPGDGVCISGRGMEIDTHDVILRHLRIRPAERGTSCDCIALRNARIVIVDHCSLSWATDELCSTTRRSSDITFQWCIMGEPLERRNHAEPVALRGARISFHHNLIAHGNRANPVVSGSGPIDFRNNVVYNWREQVGSGEAGAYNFVGNYLKPGPDTRLLGGMNATVAHWLTDSAQPKSMHISGNVLAGSPAASADNRLLVAPRTDGVLRTASPAEYLGKYLAAEPFVVEEVTTTSAEQAYRDVLAHAGATLPVRDKVDERIVADVRAGTGRIIRVPEDVGGFPALAGGPGAVDRDHDGMGDYWEQRNGLDYANPNDAAGDRDEDGYPNIEEYLNSGSARTKLQRVAPPTVSPPHGSIFTDSVTVTLACPAEGAAIRYTLDGSNPTRESPLYAGPFELRRTATVKARAFAGFLASRLGYATLRKVRPFPAAKAPDIQPGLAYEYSEPNGPGAAGHHTQWKLVKTDVVASFRADWIAEGTQLPKVDFIGYLRVPRDGVYTFTLAAPYESEMWIDGVSLARNDRDDGAVMQSITALAAGTHPIKVHYFTWSRIFPLKVYWQGPGLERQEVPAAVLFHAAKE